MQITRDTKADVIYIEFSDKPVEKTKAMGNGLVAIDIAEDGTVVGIELVSPSLYVDNPNEIIFTVTEGQKAETHS